MKSIKSVLAGAMVACAACALYPAAASAQNTSGPYVSLGAGANWTLDEKTNTGNTIKFDTGPAVVGALGYGLGNGVRLEGEIGYRSNDVSSVSTGLTGGKVSSWAFLANALYDFNLGWPVTPYLGGGLGFADVATRNASGVTKFAYQGITGLAYPLTDQLKLDGSYRFLGTTSLDVTTPAGQVTSPYRNHTVLLSLRWEFGAPRPTPAAVTPPPPAPTPVAPAQAAPPARQIQRSYLVFFDFDKSDITPEAQRIIQQAATNAKTGNVSRIQATGHADRAGPDRYNMALSIRRANAVKAALVRQGIPENQIVVIGKGETEPLVPTPDGVREPQNRRVEILLQ